MAATIKNITLPVTPLPDKLVWVHFVDDNFSAKQSFRVSSLSSASFGRAAFIWHACIPTSSSFTVWRLLHNKLPTDENLCSRGCTVVSVFRVEL